MLRPTQIARFTLPRLPQNESDNVNHPVVICGGGLNLLVFHGCEPNFVTLERASF